jgi:hypothetical protein
MAAQTQSWWIPLVLGAVLGFIATFTLKKYDEHRTKRAIRRQLRLLIDTLIYRFKYAGASPSVSIVDGDPAVDVLFEKAFSNEAVLSMSAKETQLVQVAVLRARHIANGLAAIHEYARDHPAAAVGRPKLIKEDCESVVRLLSNALDALGGPLPLA